MQGMTIRFAPFSFDELLEMERAADGFESYADELSDEISLRVSRDGATRPPIPTPIDRGVFTVSFAPGSDPGSRCEFGLGPTPENAIVHNWGM